MEIAACKKDAELFKIMKGGNKPEENPTSLQNSAWDGNQLDLPELIVSSVVTDMGHMRTDRQCGRICVSGLKARQTSKPGPRQRANSTPSSKPHSASRTTV
ncbi:hypothetical protein PF010_g27549 [Phytophthora fragariae]|uniref:Uncharacterized protein n=1 Tax=Phytophthora fragariae TaxID=53985 RepID=A0A6G0JUG4_9STRA|nr:hypothetical protein PF010_g27549 [Phytophthora fragariae]